MTTKFMYHYKVRKVTENILEKTLNEMAENGYRLVKADYVQNQFNGNYYNVIFEIKMN